MVSICRLCASLKKTENFTFIRDNNHELLEKLSKCCQLTIDLKDVLPKGVCPECVRNLNVSFEFYERVHESQQSLEKLLNLESSPKQTEVDKDDETFPQESKSLTMMAVAAAIGNDKPGESPTLSNDVDEKLPSSENEINDDVARVISEILGVKDEQAAYLILDSDSDDEQKKPDVSPEKDVNEGNTCSGSIIVPGTFGGIEYIEEDEEEIDFENHQFEIIEEDDEDDDDNEEEMEIELENQVQYESQDAEYNIVIDEECTKPPTPLPSDESVTDTWMDYSWKCLRCSEEFSSAKQLIEHNELRHKVRAPDMEWICADCLKTFSRYYTLVNHIRQRHRTHLALICDICNERCNSVKVLVEHRQEIHKGEQNLVMLLCITCGKGFYTSNSLQIHSKCHLPDDLRLRYNCNLCDKKFRTTSNLRFHQKMHTGTRDFVCDQCGKNFVQKANLEEHLVTHLTFTPYECSQCNKLFKTPERLTRHKQRHTDDKPFNCLECERTFRTKDAMNTHMRIHTGEMPFACEFCEKRFRFRSTMMTHHNVHTGTRPYSCHDCNHHFTNWPNYNKHMKRRHGIDVSSKNPRGKKPANPPKPLKKPKNRSTTTTQLKSIVKREANQDIRDEEEEENIGTEYEPEEDINITESKQEEEKPGDNCEDAI